MKIVKGIVIVLVLLAVVAAIAGMFMPSKFNMERSVVINADERVIFEQINVLKNWEQWSPWQKMDPESKMTYSGPPSGVGASYDWTGPKTGEGTLTIIESVPYESIVTELDFKENGKGTSGYRISKADNENTLTWWFESEVGKNPFKKLMFGLMGESFMSKTFDQGLSDIKQISESAPAPAPEIISIPDSAAMQQRDSF